MEYETGYGASVLEDIIEGDSEDSYEKVEDVEEIQEAYCYLVSRIGSPITEPQVADLRLAMQEDSAIGSITSRAEQIVYERLSEIQRVRHELIDGLITVY